jgi:hypothetical protein
MNSYSEYLNPMLSSPRFFIAERLLRALYLLKMASQGYACVIRACVRMTAALRCQAVAYALFLRMTETALQRW